MVDLKEDKFIALDKTPAWCWQMGTRLQWLPTAPEREVVYNSVDKDKDRYVAVVRDVFTGKTRTLPRPIYALSPDGTQAVTLDFDRLHRLRPGYGYMALPEKHLTEAAPADGGIYWMDMKSGATTKHLPKEITGPWRCDLHPRWDRSGTRVCINSAHEGTRQVYVVDIK